MDAKIDYLSFTVMIDMRQQGGAGQGNAALADAIRSVSPTLVDGWAQYVPWQPGSGRGHYGESLYQSDTYAAIRWGGQANHILIELPGTACQSLRDLELLDIIIGETSDRLTRLDIAVDIPDGCSPGEFVAAGHNDRFKSRATINSESGSTEYIGSMKSERYARVYRYAPPHPRAGVLRIEHVLRSDFAKAAAAVVAQESALVLAARLGNTFGWTHPSWQPTFLTSGKLRARRADRHEPGRVRWLHKVVLPALVKAHKEGLIDLFDFADRALSLIDRPIPPEPI